MTQGGQKGRLFVSYLKHLLGAHAPFLPESTTTNVKSPFADVPVSASSSAKEYYIHCLVSILAPLSPATHRENFIFSVALQCIKILHFWPSSSHLPPSRTSVAPPVTAADRADHADSNSTARKMSEVLRRYLSTHDAVEREKRANSTVKADSDAMTEAITAFEYEVARWVEEEEEEKDKDQEAASQPQNHHQLCKEGESVKKADIGVSVSSQRVIERIERIQNLSKKYSLLMKQLLLVCSPQPPKGCLPCHLQRAVLEAKKRRKALRTTYAAYLAKVDHSRNKSILADSDNKSASTTISASLTAAAASNETGSSGDHPGAHDDDGNDSDSIHHMAIDVHKKVTAFETHVAATTADTCRTEIMSCIDTGNRKKGHNKNGKSTESKRKETHKVPVHCGERKQQAERKEEKECVIEYRSALRMAQYCATYQVADNVFQAVDLELAEAEQRHHAGCPYAYLHRALKEQEMKETVTDDIYLPTTYNPSPECAKIADSSGDRTECIETIDDGGLCDDDGVSLWSLLEEAEHQTAVERGYKSSNDGNAMEERALGGRSQACPHSVARITRLAFRRLLLPTCRSAAVEGCSQERQERLYRKQLDWVEAASDNEVKDWFYRCQELDPLPSSSRVLSGADSSVGLPQPLDRLAAFVAATDADPATEGRPVLILLTGLPYGIESKEFDTKRNKPEKKRLGGEIDGILIDGRALLRNTQGPQQSPNIAEGGGDADDADSLPGGEKTVVKSNEEFHPDELSDGIRIVLFLEAKHSQPDLAAARNQREKLLTALRQSKDCWDEMCAARRGQTTEPASKVTEGLRAPIFFQLPGGNDASNAMKAMNQRLLMYETARSNAPNKHVNPVPPSIFGVQVKGIAGADQVLKQLYYRPNTTGYRWETALSAIPLKRKSPLPAQEEGSASPHVLKAPTAGTAWWVFVTRSVPDAGEIPCGSHFTHRIVRALSRYVAYQLVSSFFARKSSGGDDLMERVQLLLRDRRCKQAAKQGAFSQNVPADKNSNIFEWWETACADALQELPDRVIIDGLNAQLRNDWLADPKNELFDFSALMAEIFEEEGSNLVLVPPLRPADTTVSTEQSENTQIPLGTGCDDIMLTRFGCTAVALRAEDDVTRLLRSFASSPNR